MRAWVLNLDADDELAHPTGYAPRAAVVARTRALVPRLQGLVPPGDRVLEGEAARAPGFQGRAWCPTPRALAILARAGAELPDVPAFEVVRRVNHRAFAAELGPLLPGGAFVTARAALDALVSGATESGFWLLKRPHGFSGTGRRRLRAGTASGDAWVDASLRIDGLQVEPWVERSLDACLHGFVRRDGAFDLGVPCVQRTSARGEWLATEREAGELAAAEREALCRAAERCARALAAAGYFGPFGIDAYRYTAGGRERFHPLSEINARYTMGWAIGMGDRRPDLEVQRWPASRAQRKPM